MAALEFEMGGAGFHGNGAVFCEVLAAPAHTLTLPGDPQPCAANKALCPRSRLWDGAPAVTASPGTEILQV